MLSYRNPSRQCCCCIVKWLAEKRAFCESHCVWVWNEWINPLIIKEGQQERKQRNKGSRRNTVYIIIFSHAIKMDWKLNSYLCNAVYSFSYKVLSSTIERMHSCLVFFYQRSHSCESRRLRHRLSSAFIVFKKVTQPTVS